MSHTEQSRRRSTRRSLISGLGLGAGVLAAEAIVPPTAAATQDQAVIAGQENSATYMTTLTGVAGQGGGLTVNTNSGAILGISKQSVGLQANSENYWAMTAATASKDPAHAAIRAINPGLGDGLQGVSTSKNGVYGLSHTSGATGVYGDNDAAGSFTIYLNKAAPSPKTVKIAYLVLN